MMRWQFRPMTAARAESITAWRYEPPYDFYNHGPDTGGLLNPAFRYHAVTDQAGKLVGFCCYGADAQVPGGEYPDDGSLDVGIGLRPDWTGRGRGSSLLSAVIEFARSEYQVAAFRATVATFNQRSLRTCERTGFRRVQTFISAVSGVEFAVLSLAAGSDNARS